MNKLESIQQRPALFVKIALIQALLLILTIDVATAADKTNHAYMISVSGRVTDDQGVGLPGVNVLVKGTSTGTTTDADGRYSIEVESESSILIFSFIGYDTKEVAVGAQTQVDIQLDTDITTLGEVVVVGYATRAKSAVTGAIATVKSDVFENRPLNNSLDALQGTLPGVNITRASGQPGDQNKYTLQIRGYSSINGNQPLILIDGVPGDINTINPNDITQMSVLKDASAAIYGSRAADGVIIVTTKNGKKGPPVVEYTGNFGIKTPTYLRKIQNTEQFATFMDQGLRNAGLAGYPESVFEKIRANAEPDPTGWHLGVTNYPGFYGYTDWNKVIYKNSTQQLHNVSVSGGGDNNSYMVSLGYNHDDGIVRYGTNYSDRYNLRINYNFNLFDKLSVETRNSFENIVTEEPTRLGDALFNVPRQFPFVPVRNPLGQFYGFEGYENPAQYLEEGGSRKFNHSRINTNFKVDYSVFEDLKITAQAAVRFDYFNDNANRRTVTRRNWQGGVQDVRENPNSAYYENQKTLHKIFQLYADYNKKLGESHNFGLTLGTSLEQIDYEGQRTTGFNFSSNDIFTLNLADRTSVSNSFTGALTQQALSSYFGRLSYSYKQKLVLDITGRADGSSKFAPSQRWSAVFPSAALAYNLSEESFISNLNLFQQLKLRTSWGKMGNQDISELGLYDYSALVTIGGLYPLGSPNVGVPGAISNTASADRTWETIESKNIGIDLQMFRSKLSFSFDYFKKTNENMLVSIAVPATYGGTPPSSNQGKLETKGFEAIATWADKVGDFNYSVSFQLSDNTNKLVELKNSDSYGEGLNRVRVGYPIYSYFGYVSEGIIQTAEELDAYKQLEGVPTRVNIGDVMYKDVDGDGKLTAFGDKSKGFKGDMVYLGNLQPRYTYSSNIRVGYKNFDVSVFLQGVGKRDIRYEGDIASPNYRWFPSLAYFYGKTWTPENTDAEYPRHIPRGLGWDDVTGYNYRTSTMMMQNVSYLRFKTITIGYNVPSAVVNKIKMNAIRVYVSGQDLFTISKGTLGGNFDPEDGFRSQGTYPFTKVYSVGLNAKF